MKVIIRNNDPVVTSRFYMLRCLIAMAHADGIVCDEERGYITAIMNRINLTDEQRATMESDLDNAQKIEDLIKYINDPSYISQLTYFARLMAYKDGNIHPNEEALLEKLHSYATDGLDMDTIKTQVSEAVNFKMNVHDLKIHANRPHGGWFGALDKILLSVGIDLMKE